MVNYLPIHVTHGACVTCSIFLNCHPFVWTCKDELDHHEPLSMLQGYSRLIALFSSGSENHGPLWQKIVKCFHTPNKLFRPWVSYLQSVFVLFLFLCGWHTSILSWYAYSGSKWFSLPIVFEHWGYWFWFGNTVSDILPHLWSILTLIGGIPGFLPPAQSHVLDQVSGQSLILGVKVMSALAIAPAHTTAFWILRLVYEKRWGWDTA